MSPKRVPRVSLECPSSPSSVPRHSTTRGNEISHRSNEISPRGNEISPRGNEISPRGNGIPKGNGKGKGKGRSYFQPWHIVAKDYRSEASTFCGLHWDVPTDYPRCMRPQCLPVRKLAITMYSFLPCAAGRVPTQKGARAGGRRWSKSRERTSKGQLTEHVHLQSRHMHIHVGIIRTHIYVFAVATHMYRYFSFTAL